EASSSSSFSLIDFSIDFEAPLSSLFLVSPRLAESAAPAAFCSALDFAGLTCSFHRLPLENSRARSSFRSKVAEAAPLRSVSRPPPACAGSVWPGRAPEAAWYGARSRRHRSPVHLPGLLAVPRSVQAPAPPPPGLKRT